MRWFRGVLAGFFGWFDLALCVGDLEDEQRRLLARVEENELQWSNQVDKLTSMHKRATKRIQDGTQAMAEAMPTLTDMRASRAQRKAALRGRIGGSTPAS